MGENTEAVIKKEQEDIKLNIENICNAPGQLEDPKYSWKDRSRTSEEFELSLEINDKEFLDTVKDEYRSPSPSWANQKFKFPLKKDKTEKKLDEKLSTIIDEKTKEERSVSVRKRMEDEIKKEQEDIKLDIENICNASKQLDVE